MQLIMQIHTYMMMTVIIVIRRSARGYRGAKKCKRFSALYVDTFYAILLYSKL